MFPSARVVCFSILSTARAGHMQKDSRMSTTGLDVFDRTLHETNDYMRVVMRELPTDDRHLALGALRGTLHALRDRMDLFAAIHLGAQLPMLLRGLYYEGWRPSEGPTRERHIDAFLDHVAGMLPPNLQGFPEEACRAAFAALVEWMDPGEIAKCLRQLPAELRQLWPAAVQDAVAS